MAETKRTYWFLGAALLALIAVCVYVFVFSNGGDDGGDAQDSTQVLDETGQSPRISRPAEKTETGAPETSEASETADAEGDAGESIEAGTASDAESVSADPDAEAREYDKNGQVGKPPAAWRDDYSHWDSNANSWGVADIAMIGIPQATNTPGLQYQPTEEQAQRMEELSQEGDKAAADGLLSMVPKDGFVRIDFDENDFVYADPSFADRIREIAAEQIAINEMAMATVYGGSYRTAVARGATHDQFKIVFFRKPNGSLVREVTLPGAAPKEFTAASPPDFSQFSESEVESMKNKWKDFWKKHTERR